MGLFPKGVRNYYSTREIVVENWKVSMFYWFIITVVILYVIIYTIIINRGYQISDEAIGTVSTKVKGTASVGDINNWQNMTVFDAMDLIHPPVESNALFITTAYVHTPLQTRNGICNGNQDIKQCQTDSDCEPNIHHWKSQGVLTGICGSNNRCQVKGWCPLENDSKQIIFNNVAQFTIFVKNDIRFPNFNVETTNAMDYENTGQPTFGLNLFTIEDIVYKATNGEYNTSMLSSKGAIILVDINWNCNLDGGIDKCIPDFTFERIDNDGDGISYGFNFRSVEYDNNSTTRQLKKFYGIRIKFMSSGRASKFNFIALTITLGAGLAYLGIAKLLTDLSLTILMKDNNDWKKAKQVSVGKLERTKSRRHLQDMKKYESGMTIISKQNVDCNEQCNDQLRGDEAEPDSKYIE